MLALSTLSLGCAIEDGSAFGVPYQIAAEPAPRIDSGDLVFTATFSSPCAGDAAEFEAKRFGADAHDGAPAILQQTVMFVVERSEPGYAAPSPFEQEVTLEVRTPLPAEASGLGTDHMLACPPGSVYEMVKLSNAPPPVLGKPAFLRSTTPSEPKAWMAKPADWDEAEDGVWEGGELDEQNLMVPASRVFDGSSLEVADEPEDEAARVAAELATHTPEDSRAFLAHCEEKLAEGAAFGCCSSELMVAALRKKVAAESAEQAEKEAAAANASGAEDAATVGVAVDALGGAGIAAAAASKVVS